MSPSISNLGAGKLRLAGVRLSEEETAAVLAETASFGEVGGGGLEEEEVSVLLLGAMLPQRELIIFVFFVVRKLRKHPEDKNRKFMRIKQVFFLKEIWYKRRNLERDQFDCSYWGYKFVS